MHILNRGERCPKMIAMTHFQYVSFTVYLFYVPICTLTDLSLWSGLDSELFTQNFLPPSLPISFASMVRPSVSLRSLVIPPCR